MTTPPFDDQTILGAAIDPPDAPPERRRHGGAGGFLRKVLAFAGPGYLIAVGYVDPGNWATDLAGGSAFGYRLLSVVVVSCLMAMALQGLALKLGIATGRDLAQICRDRYPAWAVVPLWVAAEIAVIACDLAEVIGTAIAIQLLFGLPLIWGVCLTALQTLLILPFQASRFVWLERATMMLLLSVAACVGADLALSHPQIRSVFSGLVPPASLLENPAMLYVAIGIIGATIMPHNLYLHSAIVQNRPYRRDLAGRREALGFSRLDNALALSMALFVNAAILMLAAAAFHNHGRNDVADLPQAFRLLSPALGVPAAGVVFAVALLVSGQNSAITATLAGQVVMEGFLRLRMPVWLRRLATRALAIVPAALVTVLYGETATGRLLVLSQVILSLQLPLALVPLIRFTGRRELMGAFANSRGAQALSYGMAAVIIALNAVLLLQLIR